MSTQSFGMSKMRCDVFTFCCWLLCLFVCIFLLFLLMEFLMSCFPFFFLRCSWHIITRISVQANLTHVSNNRKKNMPFFLSFHSVYKRRNKTNDNSKNTEKTLLNQKTMRFAYNFSLSFCMSFNKQFHHFELEQFFKKMEEIWMSHRVIRPLGKQFVIITVDTDWKWSQHKYMKLSCFIWNVCVFVCEMCIQLVLPRFFIVIFIFLLL